MPRYRETGVWNATPIRADRRGGGGRVQRVRHPWIVRGGPAPTAAASPIPRVVIVVGPAGAATDRYRAQARDAAAVARRYTADVTELYSPHATWPAVRAALQGASVVIYMGHGNGWPSPYRDSLYPPTQNGFGLNPSADGNDYDHQYFGEAAIASQVKLARDAVVLLNHLCYASGNSEPGVAEGSLDTAKQRVDNFAAGFIKAGASAVLADAYASPTAYLASILGGRKSLDSIWRRAADANGNAFAFESRRSPGFVAQMDPERETSGFTRSIVLRAGLTPADVRAGARGSPRSGGSGGSGAVATTPSLISSGIRFSSPDIAAIPAAGSAARLDVAFKIRDRAALPKGIQASVRWDPIELMAPPATSRQPGRQPGRQPIAGRRQHPKRRTGWPRCPSRRSRRPPRRISSLPNGPAMSSRQERSRSPRRSSRSRSRCRRRLAAIG